RPHRSFHSLPTRRSSDLALDDLDWNDEIRIALEERTALSPDALTGLEANLRFCGPESMETRVFGRLSAWQNWIFYRPNAAGEKGDRKSTRLNSSHVSISY